MRRPFAALRVRCVARIRREAQKLGPLALRHLSLLIRQLLRCSAQPQRRGEEHPDSQTAKQPDTRQRGFRDQYPNVGTGRNRQLPARCGTRFSPPAVMRRRVAQGRAETGAQMFEPEGRVSALPARHEQRSVPVAQRRGDASGSPFLCLLSFGEAKKSEAAAGPRPGQRPQEKSQINSKQRPSHAGKRPIFPDYVHASDQRNS